MSWFNRRFAVFWLLMIVVSACNSGSTTTTTSNTNSSSQSSTDSAASENRGKDESPVARKRTFAPVDISASEASTVATPKTAAEQLDAIRAALKPFQVLLGRWNGLSQKAIADHPEWAYDWVSNPKQPSLQIKSEKGVYVREGRLSYLPDSDQFEFTSTNADGITRKFRGTFLEPIHDVHGDEKKPQRTYKLRLTEPEANVDGEQWRVTFNQQENNRYILEFDRKRGNSPFIRVDTIHTQREGTSFALSDTDYGAKTCIISQGLGTISVSYKGQSFWVCCSGCKAAFDEDPEKWIAKWEALNARRMQGSE